MKSYTDLEQSKKLAEILPLESADMHYNNASIRGIDYVDEYKAELMDYNNAIKLLSKYKINPLFEVIPCWSLAALLKVISNIFKYNLDYNGISFILTVGDFEVSNTTTVDACYKMIIKLHELNLL